MSDTIRGSGYVDNWQSKKTVTECNLHMLDTEDFSDVTFRVGAEKQVVRAHRYVLVSRSCVFEAMFCGPLAETGEVTIPDIEADIFKEFLRYVYTDRANITGETVTGLLYTSRKYSQDALFNLCVTFLEQSLSEDNVCQILEQCHVYGELDLEQNALKILTEGGTRVTKSVGFVNLCHDCLDQFVRSENLDLKEEDVFDAVLSWARERCREEGVSDTPEDIRRLLGDMRYEIRFTSMPLEYLVKVVGRSGVLTDSERVRIMDRATETNVDISPFKHSQRKAHNIIQEKHEACYGSVVNRFSSHSFSFMPPEKSAISFSTSQNILLLGCVLYGGRKDEEYQLTIRVYDPINVLIDEPFPNTKMALQGRRKLNDVLFPRSISVAARTTYTVCVDMEGPDTVCCVGGSAKVTVDGVHFAFTDSPVSTTDTTTGQIPGLIFSRPP